MITEEEAMLLAKVCYEAESEYCFSWEATIMLDRVFEKFGYGSRNALVKEYKERVLRTGNNTLPQM